MPVSVTSRYAALASYDVIGERGRTSALPARPLPEGSETDIYNHRVSGVETIEYLAWRYYGSSTAWWHLADANELAFPLDYRPGATLRVPPVGGIGRVLRTRTF